MTKVRAYATIILPLLLAFCFIPAEARSTDSVTIKAPETMAILKIKQGTERQSGSWWGYYDMKVNLQGWICGKDFANESIYRIRELNLYATLMDQLRDGYVASAKILKDAAGKNPMSRGEAQDMVFKMVNPVLAKTNERSEKNFLDQADRMSKEIIEAGKLGIIRMFGLQWYGEKDPFNIEWYGVGNFKLSRTDNEGNYAVMALDECYQKHEVETFLNAQVKAAERLQEIIKNYENARKEAMGLIPKGQ